MLVVVFGWWHAPRSLISKYTSLYKSMTGVTAVVHYTMSTTELTFGKFARHNSLMKLSKEIASHGSSSKVVFHVMSNNGTICYLSLIDLMKKTEEFSWIPKNTCGVIFDSAPGNLSFQIGMKSFIESKPPLYLKAGLASASIAGAMMVRMASGTTMNFMRNTAITIGCVYAAQKFISDRYIDKCVNQPLICPQLYLYSKEDELVEYQVVENVISKRLEKGIQVSSKVFSSSGHVAHFRTFPQEYQDTIKDFLATI